MLETKLSQVGVGVGVLVGGWRGWLDQMGIKLTQPQVELESWLSLAKFGFIYTS